MEKRIAILSMIVEDRSEVEKLNALLSEYGEHIVGRFGLPVKERNLNVISVVLDAPQDVTSALSGKIGRFQTVSAKVTYAK